jgi:hypothetical protein
MVHSYKSSKILFDEFCFPLAERAAAEMSFYTPMLNTAQFAVPVSQEVLVPGMKPGEDSKRAQYLVNQVLHLKFS